MLSSISSRNNNGSTAKRVQKLRGAKVKHMALQVRKYRHAFEDAARDIGNGTCPTCPSYTKCSTHFSDTASYADKCEALIKELDGKSSVGGLFLAFEAACNKFLVGGGSSTANKSSKPLRQAMERYYAARFTAIKAAAGGGGGDDDDD
jgi:hypothetical protein